MQWTFVSNQLTIPHGVCMVAVRLGSLRPMPHAEGGQRCLQAAARVQERENTCVQVAASQLLESTEAASSSHHPDPQMQAPSRGRSAERGGRAVRPLPSYGNKLPAQQQVRQLQMLRLQHTAARGAMSQVSCLLGWPAAETMCCVHSLARSQISIWLMIQRDLCSVRQSLLEGKHVATLPLSFVRCSRPLSLVLRNLPCAGPLSSSQLLASHTRSCT